MILYIIRLAFLNVQAAEDALPKIVEIMGTQLGWSKDERKVTLCQYLPIDFCIHTLLNFVDGTYYVPYRVMM